MQKRRWEVNDTSPQWVHLAMLSGVYRPPARTGVGTIVAGSRICSLTLLDRTRGAIANLDAVENFWG